MISRIVTPGRQDLGGFVVRRVLPSDHAPQIGPFVLLDSAGPMVLHPGQGVDVRPHPHVGLSTLTYLFDGEVVHRDNLGRVQVIRPGEVNWMTAGRGIVHSERTGPSARAAGGRLRGLQAWVALPQAHEDDAPSFVHHPAAALPVLQDGGARGRLLAGAAFGERAPCPTFSPLFYVHWTLEASARVELPSDASERAVLVVDGVVEAGDQPLTPDQLAVFTPGVAACLTARTAATIVMFGGESLGPRYLWWNFVSSRRDRLEQARQDWVAGRMALPPDDDEERIEAPEQGP